MGSKNRTAVATDYQVEAEKERSIAIRLTREGKHEEAETHYGTARHFEDKADFARLTRSTPPVVLGEANTDGDAVIAWRAKDTLRDPEQVALDASAERKHLLLGPHLDVCALALDTAASIEANNALEKMLAHQLALAHRLCFDFANRAAAHPDPTIAIKLANLSARMMDTFQDGLLTIQKLRSGNSQTVTVQHVSITGGQTVVAGTMQAGGRPELQGDSERK
jgi:hypothetical protein